MEQIQEAINQIKKLIELAIIEGGTIQKNNLIKTQIPINLLHDAAKSSLISNGVNKESIKPPLRDHKGELKLAGELKCKDQDICILPNNIKRNIEILNSESILRGQEDPYGKELTEHILSINVRSQLSSIGKNFDTLYERTFAEALNLHLRCPKMVLGEFYMVPVCAYDDQAGNNKQIGFKDKINIEKYIYAFSAINNRQKLVGEEYKYERVCLLIVDFSKSIPIIYNTDEQLKEDGLVPRNSSASINQMNFSTFTSTLLDVYKQRFGDGRLT